MPDQAPESEQSLFARASNFFRPDWKGNGVLPNLRAFTKDNGATDLNSNEKGVWPTSSGTAPHGSSRIEAALDGSTESPEGDLDGHRYARTTPRE